MWPIIRSIACDFVHYCSKMNLHIVIGISLNFICSGKSSNSAYSSIQLHRQDLPVSYDYNTLHFYDNNNFKKDFSTYQQINKNQIRPQRYGNIQYAPLILDPSEESLRTYYKTTVSSTSESQDLPENYDTTETINNLQPQYYNEHIENRYDNSYTIPLKYFGYNVKVVPKANEIVYKGDQKVACGNNYHGHGDRNIRNNFKGKMDQPYSNKMYVERQKIRQFPRKRPVADLRNLYERYHSRHTVKQNQVLPALENVKIQPAFNSYFVKAPRVHINIARAYKIALENDEAPENGIVKRIALNKQKHKFVRNIDDLLQKKSFLYPSKNNFN